MDLNEARAEYTRLTDLIADHERATLGYRKMRDGLAEVFPELGQDTAPVVAPREVPAAPVKAAPKTTAKRRRKKQPAAGTAKDAVRAVLAEDPDVWLGVSEIVYRAKDAGWATKSADPAKVVYAALSELVKHEGVSTDMHGRSRVYKHR